jgi:hypothetical protein
MMTAMVGALSERWQPRADDALAPFGLCVGGIFGESMESGGEDRGAYRHIIVILARRGQMPRHAMASAAFTGAIKH